MTANELDLVLIMSAIDVTAALLVLLVIWFVFRTR